jgi:hypothetical protein
LKHFGNADPQLKLRAIVGRLGEAESGVNAARGCAGTSGGRGGFFLIKFFAGAKSKHYEKAEPHLLDDFFCVRKHYNGSNTNCHPDGYEWSAEFL